MKCSNIKLLLSEYIDKSLNAQTHSLVEQHLKDCEKCQKDYVSLMNIVNELGDFPKINAPDDFLDNLHARMESRFDLNAILRKLFVPFKIKVPLELLTAGATAVLIIFFINVFQKEKPLTDLLYDQKAKTRDDSSLPAEKFGAAANRQPDQDENTLKRKGADVPRLKEKQPGKAFPKITVSKAAKTKDTATFKSAPAPVTEETRAGYIKEKDERKGFEETIELALLLDSETVSKPNAAMTTLDKKDQKIKKRISEAAIKKKISDDEFPISKPPVDADSSARLKSDGTEEIKIGHAEPEEEEGATLERAAEVSPAQPVDERIKAIIQNNSGRVISVNIDEKTQLPVSILAEIPVSQIEPFYSQLNQIGRLKQPFPVIDETTNEPLRVNILLIPAP